MEDPRLAEKKAVVRRYVEEYQVLGRNEVADELLATDFVNHGGPAWARTITGPESAKMFATKLRTAFPDIKAVIHQQIAEGDMVVTRKTFHGTQSGEFMGVAATGKPVVIDAIDIIRVTNGQLAEHWVIGDTQQVGADRRSS